MAKLPGSSIFRGLNFDYSVLQIADNELRIDDKVSLLFLLFEDSSEALSKATLIIEVENRSSKTLYKEMLLLWAKNCGLLWRQKFLEALVIIKSFDIINNVLDLDWKTVEEYYPMNSFHAAFIHPIKKCLYAISEALVREETDQIIIEIQKIFSPSLIIEEMDVIYFEVFLLKLVKCGFMEFGTWNCTSVNPVSLNKASIVNLMFTFFHLDFTEVHDLLSAVERTFNKLICESRQPNHGFEFEEGQVIMAARLSFNSWVEKGLATEIAKRAGSPNDECEPGLGPSRTQSPSHTEENLPGQSSVLKQIVYVPEQLSQDQTIDQQCHDNDKDEELMRSLSDVDLSESFNQTLTIGVACGERLQQANDLRQSHEESMDLVEELEKMNLGDEVLDDLTRGLTAYSARGERFHIASDVPRMYIFDNCFEYKNEDNPSRVEYFKQRPNAVNEEVCVTNAFKSLNFNDHALENLDHVDIKDAFIFMDELKENPSILVFFMVCYGLHGYMVSPNGDLVTREYLERLVVKIPELVGKPKILIIQTYMLDDVSLPEPMTGQGSDMVDLFSLWVPIPYQMNEAGGRSLFESDLPGVSMFVKSFCNHLEMLDSNKDFVSFCHDICSELMAKTNGKLMPTYTSYLSKLLFLK